MDGVALRDSRRLVLQAGGYLDEDEARAQGERHRLMLFLGAPSFGFLVDAVDAPGLNFARAARDEFLKQGAKVLDSPRGLRVFEEDEANFWPQVEITATVTMPGPAVAEDLRRIHDAIGSGRPRPDVQRHDEAGCFSWRGAREARHVRADFGRRDVDDLGHRQRRIWNFCESSWRRGRTHGDGAAEWSIENLPYAARELFWFIGSFQEVDFDRRVIVVMSDDVLFVVRH
jgi:hypothetical protein